MSGTLGPQVFLPDPANTQQSPGQGWSAGISAIGNALFPNPALLSEARLRAAQTQQLQQQTQVGAAANVARRSLAAFNENPSALATPQGVAHAQSLIAMLPPEEQAQARNNIAVGMANSGRSQADIDTFNSSAGLTNIGQTPTGQARDLQNRITTATIGAGPGYAQAAATLQANRERIAEEHSEFVNTPQAVLDPTKPSGTSFVPRGQVVSGGYSPVLPTDEQKSAYTVQAVNPAAAPQTPMTPGSHGTRPSAANTQPGAGPNSGGVVAVPANANGNPVGPATPMTPSGQDTAVAGLRILAGQPPGQANQSDIMQVTLNKLTAQDFGVATFAGTNPANPKSSSYILSPELQGQVLTRANEIMHQRLGQGGAAVDPATAVTQAYNEIITPNKANLQKNTGWTGGVGRWFSGTPPQVSGSVTRAPPQGPAAAPTVNPTTPNTALAPSANAATTPPQPVVPAAPAMTPTGRQNIPPPTSLHPSAQPHGGARFQALPGGSTGQSQPVVPGVPLPGPHQGETRTPSARVGPAPMPANQLVPHKTKVNGYIYTGGNPHSPSAWAKAAPGG